MGKQVPSSCGVDYTQYIGDVVKVTWRDPVAPPTRFSIVDAPKGRDAMARWVEYGKVDDVTDGVLRLRYSEGFDPKKSEPDEAFYCFIDCSLIEDICVLID